ncbi:hypothetical protein G6F70_002863 [Rhizopus microsporus]|nr:hypothetical protein G6F71_002797 [Rhizopus microsporus]KAG1201766.1 hypothetical protein G6F70_002863 [Rhizopus microsporus]KAG1214610.1 hypothetical protein G6F69_001776 [Rhizopus microsporus]KAG1235906.1 hypothetical protein G6F67_002401 [Rhizopus microsporus]KAG1267926.1 hypothetical protein G6F68_001531 [Rhizopus microsporus]
MPLPKSTKQLDRSKNDTNTATKEKKRHLFRFGRRSEIVVPNDKKEDGMSMSSNTDALTADDDSATKRKKSTSTSSHKKEEDIEHQSMGTTEGIVNSEYQAYERAPTLNQIADPSSEHWAPPDSWAVQPPDEEDSHSINMQTTTDYFSVVEHETWNVQSKNYCIRVFRPDGTFGTLIAPLDATANDLIQKLAGKFFLQDWNRYRLTLVRHNLERVLQPNERPLQIQKSLLEQMGYMEEDRIEDVGREDNSYLYRFIFGISNSNNVQEEEDTGLYSRTDLHGRNLLSIPTFLYKYAARITSLDLSKNIHIEIPVDFLQLCKNLKQFWLNDNEYKLLPQSVRYIPNLEHLNISGNQIENLQHARLDELSALKTLRAYNNRLNSLPDGFAKFQCLTILYISNNSFTKFPDVICQLRSLVHLDISFNKITSFPEQIGNLKQLTYLFATANRLSGSLPQGFSRLENLQELDIRQNQITDIEVLHDLPKLERISIDYNAVTVFDYGFKHLKRLRMSKNQLTQFSIKSHAWMLVELNLANCKLSSLADHLFLNMTNLECLILDGNTLTVIPSSIGVLTKLQRLSIQNNNLEILPPEISKLKELKILDAQNNNLKTLPREIWLCTSLQTLNCSSNLLETFPEPFPMMPNVNMSSASVVPTSQAGQGIAPPTPVSEQLPAHPFDNSSCDNSIPNTLLSNGFQPPPNFNPPSFFASPRNHPPPLSLSLRYLFLGDNRFTDDVWSPLSLFLELRTLNLSFNDLYEIPPDGLCHQHLYELYLSGNHLASLPADDIEKLSYLRVLAVNGNKLQTLPAEIGKLRKLLVLDVGNNVLKYNISNWPYDWNWNWNLGLKYLNLSGNKRLEIKKTHPESHNPNDRNLSDFNALGKLRMLGLMDVTILGVMTPEEDCNRRVRTSPSEVNSMGYGVADWLGPSDNLTTWDLVMPRFRNRDDECLFGLFDGLKHSKTGCRLTYFLNDHINQFFTNELQKTKNSDTIVSALRRTFLALEKEYGSLVAEDKEIGASGLVCYIVGTKLYVANVGDSLAVLSRNNGQAHEITQKHIPLNPSEISRIRAAGGYVSNSGLLNDELHVSRSFGYYHFIPVVNANPFVSTIDLEENDEFVIMASRGLWDKMNYQTAVDIARTEKDDLMIAAQKLRDFALTYGADSNIMVMIIGVGDLFNKRNKRRNYRGGPSRTGTSEVLIDEGIGTSSIMAKNKRRIKDEIPSDSTLARLDKEVPPPTNQVTLVFTDIKGSTQLWDTQPENMRSAIKIHDAVMRRTLRSIGGYEVKTEGDAFMVCFQDPVAALLWCFTVQLQLLEADWPTGILETEEGREIQKDNKVIYRGLSVRMGIHLGTPVYERNPITKRMDYFGPVVNKASRICNAADGGQICVSSDVIAALREMPGVFKDDKTGLNADGTSARLHPLSRDVQQLKRLGFHIVELGEHRLKGLETPEMLSLIFPKQLAGRMEMDKSDTATLISTTTVTPQTEVNEPPFRRASSALSLARPINRQIDPNLVASLNNLTVRLECLTAGCPQGSSRTDSIFQYSQLFHRRMEEVASDEEIIFLIENAITRIENAVSTLYLQKVGKFANVLEKLGEAIELDSSHILRALQIYSEVEGLLEKPTGLLYK